MTTAPANLLDVRQLLIDTIPGLTAGALGIVGDASHVGGYHCGSDRVVTNDYSVVESTRDSSGLTLYASALDVGLFQVTVGGTTHDLRSFSVWCVGECVAGAADTQDIREIIYSPDGVVVKRWDRLKRSTTGDSSHLTHTHLSFFRDSTKALRDETPLFRRYLTTIGLLEDDLSATAETQINSLFQGMFNGGNSMGRIVDPDGSGTRPSSNSVVAKLDYALLQLDSLTTQLAVLAARDFTDEDAIVAGILARLTPEAIAGAIPPTLAKQVADELARRLVS